MAAERDPANGQQSRASCRGQPARVLGVPHNRNVLEPRLVGYWSDEALYRGAMEAIDITFRPDGVG